MPVNSSSSVNPKKEKELALRTYMHMRGQWMPFLLDDFFPTLKKELQASMQATVK